MKANPLTNSLSPPHVLMKLESQDLNSLKNSLSLSFPSDYTHSLTFLQTMVCRLDSVIRFDQTNVLAHFSSLNSSILHKLIEMYSQGRYTITLKNKNKKGNVWPNLSLSLSLILSGILEFPK